MGATATLETRTLATTPGVEASSVLRVRNTGTVVDEFRFEVLGDPGAWTVVEPGAISLFPGAEGEARVVFRPPRSANVAAGALPFAVRVISREDPAGSVVEEGVVEVAAFSDVFAELVPRTSRGSRGAVHDLAVDNRGNARLNAPIGASDPDRLLQFDLRPPTVVADPGTAALARIGVRPREKFWRGQPKTRPFRIELAVPGQPPFGVDGTLLQEAILPGWLFKAIAALLALAILAIVLWFAFLRPTIESAAKERAEDLLAQVGITPPPVDTPGNGGNNGGGESPGAGESPGTGESPGAGESPGVGESPSVSPPVIVGPGGTTPRDGRLLAGAPPAAPTEGKTLFITDLVFANPAGGSGSLQLQRSGGDLLVLELANFRDLDFHFVTPIVVPSGQTLALVCTGTCDGVAVYYSGYER